MCVGGWFGKQQLSWLGTKFLNETYTRCTWGAMFAISIAAKPRDETVNM